MTSRVLFRDVNKRLEVTTEFLRIGNAVIPVDKISMVGMTTKKPDTTAG